MHGITTIASLPTGSGRAGALLPEVGVRVEEKTAPSALEQFDALVSPDMKPKDDVFLNNIPHPTKTQKLCAVCLEVFERSDHARHMKQDHGYEILDITERPKPMTFADVAECLAQQGVIEGLGIL